MAFEPINSTHISGFDYDEDSRELTVTFNDGRSWAYRDVSPQTVSDLRNSTSPGRFMHTVIKPNYRGVPV